MGAIEKTGLRVIENYPGNKGVQGLYQLIINNIPKHKNYYELFAGSAEIARRIAPAELTIVNDLDKKVCKKLRKYSLQHRLPWYVMNESAFDCLTTISCSKTTDKNDFIYLDPPYEGLDIYAAGGHEKYLHQWLINLCSTVKANCMISHYEHPLYDALLKNGWRKKTFDTWYHTKYVIEAIYMNYPEPEILHDYSYVGADCWQRQGLKRKKERLIKKLLQLPLHERYAIIEAITNI